MKPLYLSVVFIFAIILLLGAGCTKDAEEALPKDETIVHADEDDKEPAEEVAGEVTGGTTEEVIIEEEIRELEEEMILKEEEIENEKAETEIAPPPDLVTDIDEDGVPDTTDNCLDIANSTQLDTDDDGFGDDCDDDKDADGIDNNEDNCPITANSDQADSDEDEIGNLCDSDLDWDSDTVLNEDDNCPGKANTNQWDIDMNGMGDACDEDADGDGVANNEDNCPYYPNPDQLDENGTPGGEVCDGQIDGYMTTAVALPLAGGKAVGSPREARYTQPWSLALVTRGSDKFLYIGEYSNGGRVTRATLNDDGTIDSVESVTDDFHYTTGLVTSADQETIFATDYWGGNGSFLGRMDLDDSGEVSLIDAPKEVKRREGEDTITEIESYLDLKYTHGINRLYMPVNPATYSDEDHFYLFLPVEGMKNGGPMIDCIKIDRNTFEKVGVVESRTSPDFSFPSGLAIARVGNENRLYISDRDAHKIFMTKTDGCRMTGDVETIADRTDDVLTPMGLAVSADGTKLYFSIGRLYGRLMAIRLKEDGTAAGSPVTIAGHKEEGGWKDGSPSESRLIEPHALALDSDGNRLYVVSRLNNTIKMIQLTGDGSQASSVTNLVGLAEPDDNQKKVAMDTLIDPRGITASSEKDGVRHIYVAGFLSQTINHFVYNIERGIITSGKLLAGVPFQTGHVYGHPEQAKFSAPIGVAFSNPSENRWYLYVADYRNHAVRCIHLNPWTGEAYKSYSAMIRVASGTDRGVYYPTDLAVSDDGRYVYISNAYGSVGADNNYGQISYIEVDPDTCIPRSDRTTPINETYSALSRPAGVEFHEITINDEERWYIYYLNKNKNERKIKRLELNPETGGVKLHEGINATTGETEHRAAEVEVIAGQGQYGKLSGLPLEARFHTPRDLTFSPDKKFIYLTDDTYNTIARIDLNDDGTARYVYNNIVGTNEEFRMIDGFGSEASFTYPTGIIVLPVGSDGISLWITDQLGNALRQVR